MSKINSVNDIQDPKLKEAVIREIKKREKRRKAFVGLCFVIALGCLGYFGVYSYMAGKTKAESERLAKLKEMVTDKDVPKKDKQETVVVHKTGETEIPDVLPDYQILYNKNKSLIGWIKIADTNIDYPVMQTTNNEYYLDHNIDQQYDKNGSIFMDADCNVIDRSTNLILYGHHMKSGAMFGQLEKYVNQSFYEEHPFFQFDTIYEKATYKIAYVFRSQVLNEEDVVFKYYQFIDANSEAEFNSNMAEMEKLSFYDTGIKPVYGDQLVTLSTCDHTEVKDGRLVVVGIKMQ